MKKWKIIQFPLSNSVFYSKWYITNTLNESTSEYLHSDLVVRNKTNNGNVYSGFFDTKEEAQQTLTKYINMKKTIKSFATDIFDKATREHDAVILFSEIEGNWIDIVACFQAECLRRNTYSPDVHFTCVSTNNKMTVTCRKNPLARDHGKSEEAQLRPSGLSPAQQDEFLNPQSLSEE